MKAHINEVEMKVMDRVIAESPITEEEIGRRYGPLINRVNDKVRQWRQSPRLDRVLELGRRFRFGLEGLQELRAGFEVAFGGGAALATRGADNTVEDRTSVPRNYEAVYRGQGCRAQVTVCEGNQGPGSVLFYFRMEDEAGKEILPVYVTVQDAKGKVLLDRMVVEKSSQGVRGDLTQDCLIILESQSGGHRVEIPIHPEIEP